MGKDVAAWAFGSLILLAVLRVSAAFLVLTLDGFQSPSLDDGVKERIVTQSFVISTDGTHYYATDSVTGEILCQDRNCSTTVTNSISLLKENGSITFKTGFYPCSFTVNKELCITGEGRSSSIIHGSITLDSTIVNETPRSHNVLIQNLRMDGQNRLGVGITYESPVPTVPLITVENVAIENYLDYGILFVNASDCLLNNVVIGNCATAIYYTTDHNFGRITNCELLNYNKQGIYTDAQIYLSGTVFSAMQTTLEEADLVLDNAFGTVTGCWFENNQNTPCIDMPNTCYRPLVITGCFFANKGGDIVRMRNAFDVYMNGNFFSQQSEADDGWCVHIIQGTLYWNGNQLDPAFSSTLSLLQVEEGATAKIF